MSSGERGRGSGAVGKAEAATATHPQTAVLEALPPLPSLTVRDRIAALRVTVVGSWDDPKPVQCPARRRPARFLCPVLATWLSLFFLSDALAFFSPLLCILSVDAYICALDTTRMLLYGQRPPLRL